MLLRHNIPKMINIYTFLASTYNFSRYSTARILYQLANPLSPPGSAEDVDLTFHTLPNGGLNATFRRHLRANTNSWIYSTKVYQMENLAHKPFCTTGKPFTNAFFSCNLEDYVFIFSCLDRSKEIVRNGQRLYCDGPYEIIFAVYEYPPNRVKWCNAERDLRKNYLLSFDNEFMKFGRTHAPCPDIAYSSY